MTAVAGSIESTHSLERTNLFHWDSFSVSSVVKTVGRATYLQNFQKLIGNEATCPAEKQRYNILENVQNRASVESTGLPILVPTVKR